jgi:phosphatidylglycerophosphatase A
VRRGVRWENIHGVRGVGALVVATAMGAGLFPVAPGTLGTLVGVPIAYFTSDVFWPWRVLLWVAIFVLGIWAAAVFDELMGSADNQSIVIDEVVGFGISAWTAGRNPITLIVAFLVFRFFDIFKFPPVRQVDRWSKKQTRALGGFGVIADDVLAGLQTLAVVMILQYFGFLL